MDKYLEAEGLVMKFTPEQGLKAVNHFLGKIDLTADNFGLEIERLECGIILDAALQYNSKMQTALSDIGDTVNAITRAEADLKNLDMQDAPATSMKVRDQIYKLDKQLKLQLKKFLSAEE